MRRVTQWLHNGFVQKRVKTAQINLRLAPELKVAAEHAAAADKRSLTSLVEKLLDDHVRRLGFLPTSQDTTNTA